MKLAEMHMDVEIARYEYDEDTVIVIESPMRLSRETAREIRCEVEAAFKGVRDILILSEGTKLKAYNKAREIEPE